MEFTLLFIGNLEYVILLLTILGMISEAKICRNYFRWGLAVLILFLATWLPVYIPDINLQMAVFMVSLLLIVKVLMHDLKRRMPVDVLLAVILIGISTQLIDMIIDLLVLYGTIYMTQYMIQMVSYLVLWLFVIGIHQYIKRFYPSELRGIPLKYVVIFTGILMADCMSITFFGENILGDALVKHGWIAQIAYILMSVGVFIQLGLLIALYFSRNAYRTQQALAKKYLEEQAAHYTYLSEREQNTKKFRHDLKAHMSMIKQLYAEGKQEELEAYFRAMTEKVAAIGNRVTVNNDIADAIINRYYDEAERLGIKLLVEGHFPGVCVISPYDLCTVLSNLLSNAIEAEKEAGGSEVYIGVRYDEKQIFLVIRNDYKNPIKHAKDRFISTKGEVQHQGLGIINVKEVVDRNNGHIAFDISEAGFVARLSLWNIEQNN